MNTESNDYLLLDGDKFVIDYSTLNRLHRNVITIECYHPDNKDHSIEIVFADYENLNNYIKEEYLNNFSYYTIAHMIGIDEMIEMWMNDVSYNDWEESYIEQVVEELNIFQLDSDVDMDSDEHQMYEKLYANLRFHPEIVFDIDDLNVN